MITVDAGRRAARLEELTQAIERHADPGDRELLRSFAPVVYESLPDAVALGLSSDALTRRMLDYFRFFVREFPPPTQVYRGLPGIHVVVRNPMEADEQRIVHGRILPLETTIVETHTLDAPFIFESLKNYFRRAGLRVFSAIHPMLSVRRQWERIVALGPAPEEGSRESFCHFRIERVDSRERLARIEHEIYSVLKAVFLAVEDFDDMRRAVKDLGPGLRDRKAGAGRVEAARGFLDWLLDDNYSFLGTVKYKVGGDGRFERAQETATGVFTDPHLLPVVFPGLMDEVETHLIPNANDPRIVDIDYCNNAMAIYHLEPIDDIEIRHWGEDGSLQEMTLLLGRLSMGAFTEKASEIPLLKEKHEWILANSGAAGKSYAYREIRALFNRFPKRELFYAGAPSLKDVIERVVYMTGDEDVAVHSRRGAGYVALSIAFSRLRYSFKAEEDLKHALTEAYGPIAFSSSTDCGAVTLLLCYFDSSRMERPVDNDEVRRMTEGLVTTWEDRVADALEAALGDREGRRLFQSYIRTESRSGLYRESTPPEEVPADVRNLESLEGRLQVGVLPRSAGTVTLKLFSPRVLALTQTLRTLQNLGVTVTEELRVPLTIPGDRKAYLYRFEIETTPARVVNLMTAEERFVDALRALDEEAATDDALNVLVLQEGLSWREVELLRTLRNHLLQVRTHYNAETVNGVLLRNSAVAATLYGSFAARFDPQAPGDRAAAMAAAEEGVRKALESVGSLAEDEVLRGLDNLVRS